MRYDGAAADWGYVAWATDGASMSRQNLADLQRLFRDAARMLAGGMAREEVVRLLTDGMRACFPVRLRNDDPRSWYACLVCEDLGWNRSHETPRLYGGTVYVDVVRPCSCPKGRGKQATLDAMQDHRRSSRVRGGLSKVGQVGGGPKR